MTDKDDGGQAFPVPLAPGQHGSLHAGEPGMTLRDWFAGMALSGLLANPQFAKDMVKEQIGPQANQQWHGETSYAFADALLKARQS